MAISDKLTKLSTDITNAYSTINTKGGTIPANKNTDNLSTAINSIPSGDSFGSDYPVKDGKTHFWIKIDSDNDMIFDLDLISRANNNTITVNWGDNTTDTYTAGNNIGFTISHTYSTKGNYRIDISSTEKFTLKTNNSAIQQSIHCIAKTYFIEIGQNYALAVAQRSVLRGFFKLKKIGFYVGANNTLYMGYETVQNDCDLEEINVFSGKVYFGSSNGMVNTSLNSCYSLKKITGNFPIDGSYAYAFYDTWSIEEIDYRNLLVDAFGNNQVARCYSLRKLYLPELNSITTGAFTGTTQDFLDIYVPWSEGDVANAPWGATGATIHYNWTEGGNS